MTVDLRSNRSNRFVQENLDARVGCSVEARTNCPSRSEPGRSSGSKAQEFSSVSIHTINPLFEW
jgi:hypothetical protein